MIFTTYSNGVKTNRDAWAYNFSRDALLANMRATIAVYEEQRTYLHRQLAGSAVAPTEEFIDDFVDTDPTRIS